MSELFFKNKVLDLLKKEDALTLEEISDKIDSGKKKTLSSLNYLIKKDIIEKTSEDKYQLKIPKADEPPLPPQAQQVKAEIENPKASEPPLKLGLSEQIADLNEKIDFLANTKKKKEKPMKLGGLNVKKLKRLNKGKKRAVLMLRRNAESEILKGEYIQGMIKVGENYYDASAMYVWLFKKGLKLVPYYIIPDWSIRPLCRDEVYKKAKDENTLIDSQVITLRAMKMEQVAKLEGKKLGGLMWIGLAIGAVVIIYLIFSGGKK